jgi:hypothetical protein
MTNAIEQTKREMYEALAILKGRIGINYSIKDMLSGADEFESGLEDHLEALRIDLEEMTRLRHTYERLACDYTKKSVDLEKRLGAMTEERDSIQLRLHAVDHAYSEQQTKAHPCMVEEKGLHGDLNAEIQCDSGKPRKCLHDACKARKEAISKMHRESGDRVSCATPDVKTMALLGAVVDVQRITTDWAVNGLRAKTAIRAVSAVVNGKPSVLQAMKDFERPTTCMHSFFAIGDGQMKCTFCGVGK